MKEVAIHNSPHLSLWKSAACEALAKEKGISKQDAESDHMLLHGIDRYAEAVIHNTAIPEPGGGDIGISYDDVEVQAYLSMLNHQAVHAKIQGDKKWQQQIDKQRSRFKFGNPLWEQQWIQYFWYYWDYPYHKGQQPHYRSWKDKRYGNNNLNYGSIDWRIPSDATVALIGDIGTGTDVAATVLSSAMTHNPDVILHVGDIYYSGTPFEFQHRFIGLYNEVMKVHGKHIPMYTIPGNHEYFTGGIGFFNCLDSCQLIQHDNQRQQASYFSLRSADDGWQFLAMDTGYYGHYMDVSPAIQEVALKLLHNNKVDVPQDPTNPHWPQSFNPHFLNCKIPDNPIHDPTSAPEMITVRTDELAWHQNQLEGFSGRTVLLSHHQLYSATQKVGVAPQSVDKDDRLYVNTALWNQFGQYFNIEIAAWFWGHEHNLGIYENDFAPSDWRNTKLANQHLKKGRCVGHSAIPVKENEKPYEAKYPVPLVQDNPKLSCVNGWYNRGYQILQLQGKGSPMHVTYYEVNDGDQTPIKLYEEKIT